MTRYRLTIDLEGQDLTLWDMVGNFPHFLALCLDDVRKSDVKRFHLRKLDGKPITAAVLDACETVAVIEP